MDHEVAAFFLEIVPPGFANANGKRLDERTPAQLILGGGLVANEIDVVSTEAAGRLRAGLRVGACRQGSTVRGILFARTGGEEVDKGPRVAPLRTRLQVKLVQHAPLECTRQALIQDGKRQDD